MKALNQIIINILLANQVRIGQIESLTEMCSPARLFEIDHLVSDITICRDLLTAMKGIATGKNKKVIEFFDKIVFERYKTVLKNASKYEAKQCPHNSLEGFLWFIREGIEYNLGEHQKMQGIFK